MEMFWQWLNGKKTAIAATLQALLIWALATGIVDGNLATLLATIMTAWTGVAITHKSMKGELQ
jgi:hypothetical protein